METLTYKIISSQRQYKDYCKKLEHLVFINSKSRNVKDEIALLTLLIEKWDEERFPVDRIDPVQLLKSLMKDNKIKSIQLAQLLGVSEGLISDILNYKKGLSKVNIRILSNHFKIKQEAFNQPYELKQSSSVILKKLNQEIPEKRIHYPHY